MKLTLEEILLEYGKHGQFLEPLNRSKAISAIKEAIEEIISKDDPEFNQDHYKYPSRSQPNRIRNNLRASQRDRLNKFIGGEK